MADFKEVWVTTVDNPWDPFTQWDDWYRFDSKLGYDTCGKIALLSRGSNELSDAEDDRTTVQAIVTLLDWYDPYDVYRLAIKGKTQKFGL